MDDLLLSEVQIIVKNLKKKTKQNKTKQKYTVGLYWEVYFRKTEGTIKILVEKKNTEPSVLRKIEKITQTSLRRNFYWPLSLSKEESIKFYSNQGLDFQYQKENDQACTVKNPALKSLVRWNEEGMVGS